MEEIIKTFQIDWKLLIAQAINFAIVAGVLWWFAVKPLLKLMQNRTETIEKSLNDAQRIESELKATEERKAEEIVKAKQEAQKILATAQKQAEANKQEILTAAQDSLQQLKNKARQEIISAKEQMLGEVKTAVADLVVLTVEKVLSKELNKAEQEKIITETIKQIKA